MSSERRSSATSAMDEENGKRFIFTPSFYRIIMPSVLHEHKLVLPKNFVEEQGSELSTTIQLHLPVDGRNWYIGLKKSGDLFYLNHGWKMFMNHYSIRFAWFLLFKYKGNSVFDVHIFDLTATEVQYLPPPVTRNCNFGKSGHTKSDAVCKQEFDDAEEIREKQRVMDAAGKTYKTVNPSFNVTLKYYHIRNQYMNLPIEFMRKHMNNSPEFITIIDSDKKKWRIRCGKYGEKRTLYKGWYNFVKEKGLQIGDVCVFELVKKNAILKVDVFHANK